FLRRRDLQSLMQARNVSLDILRLPRRLGLCQQNLRRHPGHGDLRTRYDRQAAKKPGGRNKSFRHTQHSLWFNKPVALSAWYAEKRMAALWLAISRERPMRRH